MTRPDCRHCGNDRIKLRKNILQNGSELIGWFCTDCEKWAEKGGWLQHETVKHYVRQYQGSLELIQVVNDYRDRACVICGESGVESHHFAPRSVREFFGDKWLSWPQVDLCDKHHKQWHEAVTWYMPGFKDRPLAKMAQNRWMTEEEHVEHAKEVFRAWYEKAKPYMDENDREFADTVLEHASTYKDTVLFVDIIANAYKDALQVQSEAA